MRRHLTTLWFAWGLLTSGAVRADEAKAPATPPSNTPPPAAAATPAGDSAPPVAATTPTDVKAPRVIVVLRHSLHDPAMSLAPDQQNMLDEVDQRLADPIAGNPITAAGTTIADNNDVQRKIEELQIGDRISQSRVAQKLACSLGADTILRVEVLSVEGPLRDASGAPPAVAPPPAAPSPAAPPPAALVPPGKSGKGKKKGVEEPAPARPPGIDTPSEAAPAQLPPEVLAAPAKWSVKYRLTLLPAEGGSGPDPEEVDLQQEKLSGIRTQVGTVAARMLERMDALRRRKKVLGTAGGAAAVVLGAGAAGLGAWLISIHHSPVTTPVPPKERSPERYNTLPVGFAVAAVGAVAVVGGVVGLLYGTGAVGASKCGTQVPAAGAWLLPGSAGVNFTGCF